VSYYLSLVGVVSLLLSVQLCTVVEASAKSASRPAAAPVQGSQATACHSIATPLPELNEMPDDGPRYDRPLRGPDGLLLEEIAAAYRCQNLVTAEVALRKLAQHHAQSPLIPAALAFVAELKIAGQRDTPERRSHHSQMEAIEAYRLLIRDFPESPNAARARWRIGDLYGLMGSRPEARAAYEQAISANQHGFDADRASLGIARNFIALGRPREAVYTLSLLRKRSVQEVIVRSATLALGDVYAELKQFREAQPLFESAYRRWPEYLKEHPRSLQHFAETQSMLGQDTSARQLFMTYANLYPGDTKIPMMLIGIGDSFRAAGERNRAGMFYTLAAERYRDTESGDVARMRLAELGEDVPSNEAAKDGGSIAQSIIPRLGSPTIDQHQQQQVFRELAKKYEMGMLGSEALFNLGKHFERYGSVPEAIQAYHEAIERHGRLAGDTWPEAAANRLFAIRAPQVEAALKAHDEVTAILVYHELGPFRDRLFAPSVLLIPLADAHRKAGLIPEALKLYHAVLGQPALKPMHEPALFGLALSYLEQSDFTAARQAFGRYALQYPHGRWKAEALRGRALAYQGEGNRREVIASCREWIERYGTHRDRYEVLLLLARTLDEEGQLAEAIKVYGQAEQADADPHPTVMLRHGDLLAKSARFDEAVAQYRETASVGGKTEQGAWARIQMARVLAAQKRYADARVVLLQIEDQGADELISRLAHAMRVNLPLSSSDEGG
jgi:tetratricopeptide (TPR) repeat protein